MQKTPLWVREDVVLAIHKRQIAEHGGIAGVRDLGLLQSALQRPQNKFSYETPKPTLAALAASYAYGLASNHPFLDGNKRVAFVVCRLFLKLNGVDLVAEPAQKYATFMALAAGTLSEDALEQWIGEHLLG